MNKRKVIFLCLVEIVLIFSLVCISYNFAYIIKSYRAYFVLLGDKITSEQKMILWERYGTNLILDVLSIIIIIILLCHFSYLLFKQFPIYEKFRYSLNKKRTERFTKKQKKISSQLKKYEREYDKNE